MKKKNVKAIFWLSALAMSAGCSTTPGWLPSSGPSLAQITTQEMLSSPAVLLVDVDETMTRRVLNMQRVVSFAESMGNLSPALYVVGAGDALEVSIWEAPPAALFGASATDARGALAGARQTTLPAQVVGADGSISVPFAGSIPVVGRSPKAIEGDIVRQLVTKANQPQVLLRVIQNASHMVTVVGEVASSTRMPLTPKGERLLDAVASAGGVRQPVGKMTIQVSRSGMVTSMPLESVIQEPRHNIHLRPGDVVTALFQPLSFTALGAAGRNEEISFEAQGISLAQALGRMAGLKDAQADARGVFVFRFEQPEVLEGRHKPAALTPDGKVPVVYRADLKDPRTFLVAQNFPIKHKDVVYVSNAPAAELQKFLNIVGAVIGPIRAIQDLSAN